MLSDEYPESDVRGPITLGGTSVALQVFVSDVEPVFASAESAGGTILKSPQMDPFGDLAGKIRDPFGHEWLVSQQVEVLKPAEMVERFKALFDQD